MKRKQAYQGKNKNCLNCGCILDSSNTKAYRLKNYIYKCNDCVREEKKMQARKTSKDKVLDRSIKYRKNLKESDPVKYTCIQMHGSSKKRAISLCVEHDIDTEFLISIAPEICPILGGFLKYGGGEKTKYSASIDRIDSSKGYTKDNVQIISNLANMMKNEADETELKLFASWVFSR